MRQYFLGSLTQEESDAIDLRIISDPEFGSAVVAAETELVEDYLDGRLTDEESALFDENYLITPERRKNVQAVIALRSVADRHSRTGDQRVKESTQLSLWDRIRSMVQIPVFAAALILAIVVGGYFYLAGGGSSQLQSEYAALNRSDLSNLDDYRALSNITVLPGNLRGSSAPAKQPNISGERILVRIVLTPELRESSAFNVSVKGATGQLLRFEGLRSYAIGGGRELRLLLPAKSFGSGTYKLEVSTVERPELPTSYDLGIE